jgi:protoporphyrinogen oxidase
MASWGIVGGGVLGMTLAHRLVKYGHEVTIFEASPVPGGLLKNCKLNDVEWDSFYHVILKSDLHLRSLLRELDLEKEINWVETKTGFYSNGKLYSMSNVFEYLKFPLINLIDKFRLGITIINASREKDWMRLEKIPIENWLTRWSGKNTYEKIWAPLLRAKLGKNYKSASAAFIWATIQRMYAARNSGIKKEMFGYINGNYKKIIKKYLDKLDQENVTIKTGHSAQKIFKQDDGKISIKFNNGSTESFDQVIMTIPSSYVPQICSGLSIEENIKHKNIKYLGVICVSLLLRKSLSGYYITNITDENLPFTGVIEMSALVDKSQFGGNALVYLPKYLESNDNDFSLTDEEIKNRFWEALLKMYPDLNEKDLLAINIARAKYVFALPALMYSENLPPISTSIHGLHIVNTAHIVNGTLNVNETINLADASLQKILALNKEKRTVSETLDNVNV